MASTNRVSVSDGYCGTGYLQYLIWCLIHGKKPHPPDPGPWWDQVIISERVVNIKTADLPSLLKEGYVISTKSTLGKTVQPGEAVLQKVVSVQEIVGAGVKSLTAAAS